MKTYYFYSAVNTEKNGVTYFNGVQEQKGDIFNIKGIHDSVKYLGGKAIILSFQKISKKQCEAISSEFKIKNK